MSKRDVLKEIVQKKKEKLLLTKGITPEEALKNVLPGLEPARPFLEAINKPRVISLIAEIKKASPSSGIIRSEFNHQEIAKTYNEAGVQAISVLTEDDFFLGNLSFIKEIRPLVSVPILRKDFIFDSFQVYESRAAGADAILLIAGLLTKEQLAEFISLANSIGLGCLVEAHTEKELKKVLSLKVMASGKPVQFAIGLNSRDLHTLEVDLKTIERLFPLIPKGRVVVVESGIKNYQDTLFLKILGVNAVLIGEAFMRSSDIRKTVEEVMGW